MNGIIGRISWDGCEDCKNYEGYAKACTEEINMSDLEIDMETDDVVCKIWKERGGKMKIPINAEIDRLRTENKELKDAIHSVTTAWYGRLMHDDVVVKHIETALKIVNRSLMEDKNDP